MLLLNRNRLFSTNTVSALTRAPKSCDANAMDIGEYPFDLLVAGNSGGRPVELVLKMMPTPTRIAERPAYPPGKYCKEP